MAENVNVNETIDVNESVGLKSKLIFNARLMKYLIEEKHMADQIIGLKANRDNPERTIFVVNDSLSLRDAMQEYTKERRKARAERAKVAETAEDYEKEPILQED